jgi:sortase A
MSKHPQILLFSEVSSYVIGASLVLYAFSSWASGQLDNKIAESAYISQQARAENTVTPSMDLPGEGTSAKVDIVDWSVKRIAAWRETFDDDGPEAFAMLSVPSAGISVPLFKGADDRNLNAGAALIKGTDEPGVEYGNTGIAGHRDGFFRGLQNVKIGEPITINANGEELSYRISDITIVDPTNIDTLLPQQSEVVTLVTCYPFYFVGHAPQRYVVQAVRQK